MFPSVRTRLTIGLYSKKSMLENRPHGLGYPGNYHPHTFPCIPAIPNATYFFGSLGLAGRSSRFGGVQAATPPAHPQIWAPTPAIPTEPVYGSLGIAGVRKEIRGIAALRSPFAEMGLTFFNLQPTGCRLWLIDRVARGCESAILSAA